jgi:23S rRNA pseudouridine1911/1915/1917 synthase
VITVPAELDGSRLDRAVAKLAGCGRGEATALIAAGAVRLDGDAITQKSRPVRAGQSVEIDRAAVVTAAPTPTDPGDLPEVPIRYEDDALLVVAKPAGLVVHPAPGHRGATLVDVLARLARPPRGGDPTRPGIVHRLDRDTSGLLVVARTDEAHARLSAMLKEREITRRYDALVDRRVEHDALTIDAPIGRDPRARTRMAIVADGRDAVTDLDVVDRFESVTLVRATLRTGRTHQIRVHLSGIDHPVSGDTQYGADARIATRFGLTRPFLHASHLRFRHPLSGQPLLLDEPLPPDLAAVLTEVRRTLPDQASERIPPHRSAGTETG